VSHDPLSILMPAIISNRAATAKASRQILYAGRIYQVLVL